MNACRIAVSLFAVWLLTSGCTTSGYLGDRGRDAADIFTCTAGVGAGAKARVAFVQAGALFNIDMHGLRGGQWGEVAWYETQTLDVAAPWPMKTREFSPKLYPYDYPKRSFGQERWQAEGDDLFVRRKQFEAVSPLPLVSFANDPAYYTQVEVVVGLFGSLRLGANPGELLDFVLGWVGADIFQDDLAAPLVESGQNESGRQPR